LYSVLNRAWRTIQLFFFDAWNSTIFLVLKSVHEFELKKNFSLCNVQFAIEICHPPHSVSTERLDYFLQSQEFKIHGKPSNLQLKLDRISPNCQPQTQGRREERQAESYTTVQYRTGCKLQWGHQKRGTTLHTPQCFPGQARAPGLTAF